ncbi:DUF952 domain-containing protein [Sandaracinobacteroides saxicola]|uniref:DUF952 domain-containing protein n=1 Tax=Sandaracinobacteroides saxicola TaxID=2759707 RepID=A0A7G5IJB8_9SPHN|nr:DUF952 domain-containing protein [Sandaracinobacteroides saxicola]QMW23460.1 DUF952 domain-containing protein [Sandaracinobacteroides saxicola]
MTIVKIFRAAEWAAFQATGRFAGSADDVRDGFIHLSTGEQVAGTLERHFKGETQLILAELALDEDDPTLKWEVSRGGTRFPHLYRALTLADVLRSEAAEAAQFG